MRQASHGCLACRMRQAKHPWQQQFVASFRVSHRGCSPTSLLFLCYKGVMDRQDIIARLRENEAALRARGVAHAALFGSRARGDARPDSDTDIMIEIDPDAPVGVYEYVRIKEYIANLFDGQVDVVDREGLKPYVRPAATSDAIYAF